jgi:hypothetical protein
MTTKKEEEKETPKLSKNEEIAYHKGALQVLAMEYSELVKMAKTVEAVMGGHLKRLQELGVKINLQKK